MNLIEALETGNYEELLRIPKSDIHCHAGRGGNRKFISERTGSHILQPHEKYDSLSHMQKWFEENIKPICRGKEYQNLYNARTLTGHELDAIRMQGLK